MARGIPIRILERIEGLLNEDDFKEPIRRIYVKTWNESWRAWIGVDGSPYALSPRIGIFNTELQELRRQALQRIGAQKSEIPNLGPPLIMTSLEELIGDDVDCLRRVSWHYAGTKRETGSELPTNVADDIVYCVRKKAYPFFDMHVTFESILNAVRAGMASHALPFYLPIILLKMGRRADAARYAKGWMKQYRNESSARSYERYVDALTDIFAVESKH